MSYHKIKVADGWVVDGHWVEFECENWMVDRVIRCPGLTPESSCWPHDWNAEGAWAPALSDPDPACTIHDWASNVGMDSVWTEKRQTVHMHPAYIAYRWDGWGDDSTPEIRLATPEEVTLWKASAVMVGAQP